MADESGKLPFESLTSFSQALGRTTRLAAAFSGRDFPACLTGFGESDCDCLFAALDLFSGFARLQLAALHFMHRAFNFLRGFFPVLFSSRFRRLRFSLRRSVWQAALLADVA